MENDRIEDKHKNISHDISKCPFKKNINNNVSINLPIPSYIAKAYNLLNYLGIKYLGKFWPPQYFGALYPGIISHKHNYKTSGLIYGHKLNFNTITNRNGKEASFYFFESGISELASKNNGICTFWMGLSPAIYQNTNTPLIKDEFLAPSTAQNKNLFGEFMGVYESTSEIRRKKRQPIEVTMGSITFINSKKDAIQKYALEFLNSICDIDLKIEDFSRNLVSYIDSFIPGILDLTQKPLPEYINSESYYKLTRNFFDLASDVISKLNKNSIKEFDSITSFVKELLSENFNSISNSPESNIFKQYFKINNIPFDLNEIQNLNNDFLKELGTIIIATYDTTCLSLSWAISYIEENPKIKENVIIAAKNDDLDQKLSYIDFIVLEAIRLGGSNPTALWRKVINPFDIEYNGQKIRIRKGTMLWLDRRKANQDSNIFPDPNNFNPENIKYILKTENESFHSLMSFNRYEINSFSMVNTFRNPRKCPARIFSAYIQSSIVKELYKNFEVTAKDISTELKLFSSMPKPACGSLKIKKISSK